MLDYVWLIPLFPGNRISAQRVFRQTVRPVRSQLDRLLSPGLSFLTSI